jgi:hypothetical protein
MGILAQLVMVIMKQPIANVFRSAQNEMHRNLNIHIHWHVVVVTNYLLTPNWILVELGFDNISTS